MARPTTAKLDQARIRAAALALVDADGLDRLSMRRLAAALDVSAASLYFHYATKDDLLESVAADVLADVDTAAFARGWETGLRVWARSLSSALALDVTQDVELAMELGYTSLALRSMFGTNNGIAGQVLVSLGTDEQKDAWLRRLAAGEVIASFALTEPGAGSNPAGLRTRAVRDGDEWVISGAKRYITNAPTAGLFIVFARIRAADGPDPGIAVFLVPAGLPGLDVGPRDRKMGQEGAWTADVTLDGVRVPAAALVGGSEAVGYQAAMSSLARGRLHIAAVAVGAARRALDESVRYAATATQGGTVIGDFQLVQAHLADMQTGVLAGQALVRECARSFQSGQDRRIAPSVAKLFCTEMAGQVADKAVQVHGGAGYLREVPVERIYRDVRLLRLYEGTSEIQRLIIGSGLVRNERRQLKR